MDLWRMILSEHANIEELCREVLEATPTGPNSRAELFEDLKDELERHIAAKQNVLYPAFSHDGRTETYLHELDDEHRDIRRRLAALSAQPNKNTRQWALDFKELAGVIRHAFSLEENGALVTAHGLMSREETDELRRAYEREKIASYEASRWHMPQAMMPSRYGMPTGMTFGLLAGALAIGGAALAWSLTQGGRSRSNQPLRPARHRPEPPFPLDSGVIDRSLSRRGMEGRASSGATGMQRGMGQQRAGQQRTAQPGMGSPRVTETTSTMDRPDTRAGGAATGSSAGSDENWFSSANPPRAPSGLSTPLQPSGTVPSGSPASSVGSVGTGGGQTENRSTGSPKQEGQ
ncbi:hemerythrin domain-containing protein [Microvirga guangxiensis]|uniref:Hemerythrin HHE cation binding domain-containing protein n=1 Tax=Microvirga guangxiensis TaxID=549386 RepID=A0A1G5JJY5_9HYPH|nr:hemerythrin domain-containing protein [Microvirga guangxiensis]SCY88484.1 Hemerythrin HHE cation binding domain-containing protein [Microvirga guangxiensis]